MIINIRGSIEETMGTLGLIFCGTGSKIINDKSGDSAANIGINGNVSGAHINQEVVSKFRKIHKTIWERLNAI